MGLNDALYYVLIGNPVSATAGGYAKEAASILSSYLPLKSETQIKMVAPDPLWKMAATAGPYVRLAAFSGAAAVILGAYGAHRKYPKTDLTPDLKSTFETASRYHFYHTLAMLALPLTRNPFLAAVFMTSGMVLFCGTCYYYAFTGDKSYSRFTPFGGMCLIFGWVAMLF